MSTENLTGDGERKANPFLGQNRSDHTAIQLTFYFSRAEQACQLYCKAIRHSIKSCFFLYSRSLREVFEAS